MLNPAFSDGTRLRLEPTAESEFNNFFVMNDREIEVLELVDDFVKLKEVGYGADPNAIGWARNKNITRSKRVSGLDAKFLESMTQSFSTLTSSSDLLSVAAEEAAPEGAPASSKQGNLRHSLRSDNAAYEAAKLIQDGTKAAEVAHHLKIAIEDERGFHRLGSGE